VDILHLGGQFLAFKLPNLLYTCFLNSDNWQTRSMCHLSDNILFYREHVNGFTFTWFWRNGTDCELFIIYLTFWFKIKIWNFTRSKLNLEFWILLPLHKISAEKTKSSSPNNNKMRSQLPALLTISLND
jgi:hypothetical protein